LPEAYSDKMLEIWLLKGPSNRPLTTGVDNVADFTGGATDDVFNANMATMQSLDAIDGGAGKDTLNIRDTASITARSGSHAGIEVLNVESTAGSVGQVAAAATIAAKQSVQYDFSLAGVTTGSGTVKVTVGGVETIITGAASAVTVTEIASAIEKILDDANGTSTTNSQLWTSVNAGGDILTVTAAVAGVALPSISIAAGSSANSTFSTTPTSSSDVFRTTLQANQKAADAVASSTFSAMTGATEVSITAATTANVSSVSTAATTVSAGGAVVLSGGASQAVTTYDSVQVSGSTGQVSVNVLGFAPSTLLAPSSTAGWSEAAGVFVRGGTTVSVTEVGAALNSTRTAVASGGTNATSVQIGANPGSATGNSNGAVTSNAITGAQVIGNLSSAPTGDVTVSARTTYTGTNGLTNVAYGTGEVKVFMNGGTTASVTGAGVVSLTDIQTTLTKASTLADALPGVSKLATVNLTGVTSTTAIKSDAIAAISAVDTSSTITVTSNTGANTGGIALNVANSTVTLAHANATSVSVGGAAGSGRQSVGSTLVAVNQGSTVTLTTARATSLEFSGANDVTLGSSSTLTALTTITSSATGAVSLGTVTGYAKVTSVDMSNAGGSASATLGATISGGASDRGFAYTGSAGSDTVTLAGIMKSGTSALGAAIANTINLGAGNDLLLSNGSGSIASGSAVNGGSGTDTIAASLLNAGNAAQITGFELLGLDKASGDTYDTDLLAGAAGLVLFAQGATYTNVDTAQSLNVVTNVGSSSTTLQFAASQVAGTSDSYTVNFAAKGDVTASANPTDVDAGTLVVQGVENVTINSGKASGFADNFIDLTSANLKTVTINGDMRLFLGFAGTNGTNASAGGGAVKLIDGSAATGAITINTGNVVADNVEGLVLKTGSGNDAVTLAANVDTVNLGAGDDSVTTAAFAVSLTLGAGKDTVTVAASKVDTLADTTAPFAATLGEATGRLVTITDVAKGDTIDFEAATTAGSAVALGAATSVGAATSLLDALNALANSASKVAWTVYGGNTYVLYDAVNGSSDTTGVQADDIIVKFDGAFDFSTALYGATAGALTIV
jgi:hypothetical protein